MNIIDILSSTNLTLREKLFANNYPLYYQGREVGVFSNIAGTCNGTIALYKGEKIEPQNLVVGQFLGPKIPLSQFCINKGYVPQWAATDKEKKTLTYTAPDGTSTTLTQTATGEYKAPTIGATQKNLIIAGAGVLAAIIVLRR